MHHHRRRRRRRRHHGPKIAAADSTAAARAKAAKPKPSLSAETEFRLCFVFCHSFTLVVEEKTFFPSSVSSSKTQNLAKNDQNPTRLLCLRFQVHSVAC